ncbi:dethiobiotin synthase [Coxiella endosymbiont of Ornithodoros amblus]|uniref:dethiobiotin synthase n=1 Tax=Coxiella endosymbiont of Ornithodoros amblus TaxID=1656166 RepID=UPI00244E3BAE|nr:dethiobiotin synthase [Coxiella endosymbiont of Ornithodoros amblus]MBW5803098.1 dethiobiotin synthase [Coxiella endosymbiont of Ornithodoros amblus]
MKFFITGTDTGVGKTYVSTLLLHQFNNKSFSTFGIKPIASGCCRINNKLYNDDALALQKAASIKTTYEHVNLISLESPVAPHIAAKLNNHILSKNNLARIINQIFNLPADVFIVEGVGGWFVPLNEEEFLSDLVKLLKIPVVLVIGIKLGCLNHAFLTVKAMLWEKIPLVGWVANCIEPDVLAMAENIQTLRKRIKAPCLGVIPYGGSATGKLFIQPLLNYFSKVVSPEENIR